MEQELNKQLGSLDLQSSKQGSQTSVRVRKMKPQLPQGINDKDLTDKQIHAFSKDSLLKPAMQTGSIDKMTQFLQQEEMKEPHMKEGKKSLYQNPQSNVSASTFSSDSREEQGKSLVNQRQSSTSQLTFERPQSAATQALLFNPNELVEENTVVAQLVKNLIMMLQRCLKSKNQAIFYASLDSVFDTSDNYGPAINKHLHLIWPMIAKRSDKTSFQKIDDLKQVLLENGGEEAFKIFSAFPPSYNNQQ